MLTREEINSIFSKRGISVYESRYSYDSDCDILLKSDDIYELSKLAKENNIKSIFYTFYYLDKEEFIISDEDKEDPSYVFEDDSFYISYNKFFEKNMRNFNRKIDKIDFSRPIGLYIFLFIYGQNIGIMQSDNWDENIPDKYIVLDEVNELLQNITQEYLDKEKQREQEKEERIKKIIEDYLDSTDEWHIFTNQQLRYKYCTDLAKKLNKEYGMIFSVFKLQAELELKWRDYKALKNKNQEK